MATLMLDPDALRSPDHLVDDVRDLRAWSDAADAAAFGRLVDRHVAMVDAACRRCGARGADVDEAVQATFLILARRGGGIRDARALPSWLHRTALRAVAQQQRGARRRARHEAAVELPGPAPVRGDAGDDWMALRLHLDAAIAALRPTQRDAVIRHYLEGKPLDAVAAELGISSDAARMRLGTGVERLRSWFARRGLSAGAASLVAGMTSEAAASPPSSASGCRSLAASAPTPAVQALSIAIVGDTSPWVLALAVMLLIGGVAGLVLAGGVGEAPAAPASPPVAMAGEPAPIALDTRITIAVHAWPLADALALVEEQLPPGDGLRIAVVDAARTADPLPRVDLALVDVTVRAALDEIARQSAWRWRRTGVTVVVDRALPVDSAARVDAACAGNDAAALTTAAQTAADGGDLDALARVLAAVFDARLDALPEVAAARSAILGVAASCGGSPLSFMPTALVQAAWADDARARAALVRAWTLVGDGRLAPSSPLVVLTGAARVADAAPSLRALMAAPVPTAPFAAAAAQRRRLLAAWALGMLGDRSAVPALVALAAERSPASIGAIDALGRLGGDEARAAVTTAAPWASWPEQALHYVALHRLDAGAPDAWLSVHHRDGTMPKGWIDGFFTHPSPSLLPQALAAPELARTWFRWDGIRMAASRLPADRVLAAVRERITPATSDGDRLLLLALMWAGGDDAAGGAWASLAATPAALPRVECLPVLARIAPDRRDPVLRRYRAAIDIDAVRNGQLQVLLPVRDVALTVAVLDASTRGLGAAEPDAVAMAEHTRFMVQAYPEMRDPASAPAIARFERAANADRDRLAALITSAARPEHLAEPRVRADLRSAFTVDHVAVGWHAVAAGLLDWPDSRPAALAWLERQDPDQAPSDALVRLTPNTLGSRPRWTRPAPEVAALFRRWLAEASRMEARQAALWWLGITPLYDHRPYHVETMRAVAAARVDPDANLQGIARSFLQEQLAWRGQLGGMELFCERDVLAGRTDDPDGIAALDAARPTLTSEAQPPAKPPANDF